MKDRINKLLSARLVWMLLFLHLFLFQVKAQQINDEDVVKSEFASLQQITGLLQTKLVIDNVPGHTSEANNVKGIIVFNLLELRNITDLIGKQFQRDVIRLVLAHEMAHQIQYQRYSNINGSLFYECQADVIAGFLIYQLTFIEMGKFSTATGIKDAANAEYQKKLKDWNDRFSASLTAIFDAGSNYVLQPSHPTNDERRLALRDGYTFGYIWTFGAPVESDTSASAATNAAIRRKLLERYKILLNYLPQDDLLVWSTRHARKIIHSFLPNAKNIIIYTNWNIDSSHVYSKLTYVQRLTNIGSAIITVNYANQVYNARKSDPQNTLYWQLAATDARNVTLAPGASISVTGEMEYLTASDFSVVFTYPGKKGALYTCTTLHDQADNNSVITGNKFFGEKPLSDENILDAFLSTRDLLSSYVGGVGISARLESNDNISYLSVLQIPSATTTNILYNSVSNQYNLEALYYQGTEKELALQSVQKIMQILQNLGYNYKASSRNYQSEDKIWNIFDKNDLQVGQILIEYSPSFHEFKSKLLIKGLKENAGKPGGQ